MTAAVTGWRKPVITPTRFTVHRANGWMLYLGVFLFLMAVESTVVHLVLTVFVSAAAAWVATGMAAYGAIWFVGDAHTLRHGGVILGNDSLAIRVGVRWRGEVPWSAISSIEVGTAPDGAAKAAVLDGNVVVRLRTPCELRGLFGRRRMCTAIALSIDEPNRFVASALARANP